MELSNSGRIFCSASDGDIQLLVGPASSGSSEQMKVRCSVRATSCGLERWRKQLGKCSWFTRMRVPSETIWSIRRSFSASLPSHQTRLSGCVKRETSSTHSSTDDDIGVFATSFNSLRKSLYHGSFLSPLYARCRRAMENSRISAQAEDPVAQWIERVPAEDEAVRSNRTGVAISTQHPAVCGRR